MSAVDLLTVRNQKFGYGEHFNVTGGLGQASVVVTSLADSGAGTLRDALASGNRYVTFGPSIWGGTIDLTSNNITCSGDNVTVDGGGANITITGDTLRFTGTNVIVAGLTFKDPGGGIGGNDSITIRRDVNTGVDQLFAVYGCTFDNAAAPNGSDSQIDVIFKRDADTRGTVAGCAFLNSNRAILIHSGASDATEGGSPTSPGVYEVTTAWNRYHKIFERWPLTRDSHVHKYNELHSAYGGIASAGNPARMGNAIAPPAGFVNWLLAENCIAYPNDIGDIGWDGGTVTNAQEAWFSPSGSNDGTPNMKAEGTYLKTKGGTTPTETEIDTASVGTPAYDYRLATANDALQTFLEAHTGHGSAIRTTLPVQFANPVMGFAILWDNQEMVAQVDESTGSISAVSLVIGGGSPIPMVKRSSNTWACSTGSLTEGTETTVKTVASLAAGGTVDSPTYPAFVAASGPQTIVAAPGAIKVTGVSGNISTASGNVIAGSVGTVKVRGTSGTIGFVTLPSIDILTVREQKFGYAEHHGVTGGFSHPLVMVTNLNDSGAGSYRAALASGNRWITFDPSIWGGVINLGSTLVCSGSNITIDGTGCNMTVTGNTSRFEGDNIVIAGMQYRDAGGISNDCITLRRPTTPTTNQRVIVSMCTLANPADPANTDTCIDIIWRRGWDTIVTVVGTFLGRSKRGSLIHAGDSTAPGGNEARGWYYVTWAFDHWFKTFERHCFSREAHVHMYNNYHQRYGGAASAGSGCRMGDDDPGVPRPNWTRAENNVVLPLGIGEDDYLGVAASNPQEKWFGPSSGNNGSPNMRADGTYLKTNPAGSITPTEEEIDPGAVGTPPYQYKLGTANDALQAFIESVAGHPAAIKTTLPNRRFINPAIGFAILSANQEIVAEVDETLGTFSAVDLVIGSTTIAMTKTSATQWKASAGALTPGTSTTIKVVGGLAAGGTVSSPTYPAFVAVAGDQSIVSSPGTVKVRGIPGAATGGVDPTPPPTPVEPSPPIIDLSYEFRHNEVQLARVIVEVDGKIIDDTFYNGEHLLLNADESSLKYDRLNEARTTGTFKFLARTTTGEDVMDAIAGAILYPFAGTVVNGEQVWAPLGKLLVHETNLVRRPGGSDVGVSLVDMSEKVRDNPFKQPFQTGGSTYKAAIEAILANRFPDIAPYKFFLFTYAQNAPVVTYVEEDDPWSAIFNLAASSRSEIWLDKNGYLVYDEVPDPETMVPFYNLGGDQFRTEIGRRSQTVSRRDVYNGVIVRGEAPWLLFPISGEYWDDDPSSPTWRGGPMGEKPYLMGDPVATTNAQCAEIAETEFRKRAGITETVTFNMLKDPLLEVRSMISLNDEPDEDRFFILDTLNFPMGAQPMTGELRRKRL